MYNTTTLLAAVKRNILATSNSFKFNDSDYIQFLNEEQAWLIQSELTMLREDFFIDSTSITLTSNQSTYKIPEKASYWSLTELYFVDAAGVHRRLTRWARRSEFQGNNTSNDPIGFYLEDNKIHLYPDTGASPTGTLLCYYERIVNQLTELGNCGVVQSAVLAGTDYQITVDAIPIGYTSGVDVINSKNPYELIGKEKTASVGGFVVTVPASGFDRIPVAGDYVVQTGFTPVPHLPSEFHPILAMAASVRALEAMGDTKNYQAAQGRLSTMIDRLKQTSRNRVKSAPKKIVSRNATLDSMRYRRRWF